MADVADPSRGAASFHDDQVDVVGIEQMIDVGASSENRLEPILLVIGIEETGNGFELAEVECADHHERVPWLEVSTK